MCYYIPHICFSYVIIWCAYFRLLLFDYVIVLFTSYISLIWLYSSVNLLFCRYIMLLLSSSYSTIICCVLSSTSVCVRWVYSSYYLVVSLVLHIVLLLLCTIRLSIIIICIRHFCIIQYYYHCTVPSLYCILHCLLVLIIVYCLSPARVPIGNDCQVTGKASHRHKLRLIKCLWLTCQMKEFTCVLRCWCLASPAHEITAWAQLQPSHTQARAGQKWEHIAAYGFCQSSCPVGHRRCPCGTEVRQWQALEARRSCNGCSVNQRPCEGT